MPQSVNELKELGAKCYSNREYLKAIEYYKTALSMAESSNSTNLGELYIKLGNTYYRLEDKDNYIKYYEHYLELFPKGQLPVFSRLAHAYYFIDNNKSIKYHDKGNNITINDYNTTCKIFAMIKSSKYTQEEIRNQAEFEMTKLRNANYSEIKKYYSENNRKNKKNGRLNIGYLSSDCHCHIMMNYILPIWKHHNKDKFNIVIFNCSKKEDSVTKQIKQLGHNVINCANLSLDKLAETIYEQDIDILVDLGGFTHLKTTVNFYKPAPVIISYLGYLNTCAIEEVDYILADKFTIPEESQNLYTEKVLYLDTQYKVFEPTKKLPEISDCPFTTNDYITFGSFNCTSKFSETSISLWAKILQNVSNSKLLIYRTQMTKATIKRLQKEFRALGISDDRIIYKTNKVSPHLYAYTLADIALDTYPFSGMSICTENALMGVPTVTYAGEALQSRGAATVNSEIGLKELIANSEEKYIEIAKNLAKDTKKLRQLRKTLRKMIINSCTCSKYEEFTRDLEDKYQKAWNEYTKLSTK